MRTKAFDVVIIGGGINGAGLFRELCEQQVDCLLVEKGDFGGGTSAVSSRLIHGGIKYLETGEFRLVAESTFERNRLLRNAPHLVRPLPTVLPTFSRFGGIPAALKTFFGKVSAPRNRGAVLVRIGLWLYDFYGARDRVLPKRGFWSRKQALQSMPSLTPRIVGAGVYHDAVVRHPERLVLELVQDAVAANSRSQAFNYASVEGVENGKLRLTDSKGVTTDIVPGIVVNAAGPWIDKVNKLLGIAGRLIGGTRGSHLLLDHPELVAELAGRMLYYEADDGRICLVFPYHGRALVGSTDIRDDDPDTVRCTDEEVEYLVDSLRMLLPGHSIDRSHIVHVYSGIRPLPASDGVAPGLVSRDHSAPVEEPEPGRPWPVISLVGGKWTTFRGFSEIVADDLLSRLNKSRSRDTRDMAIGGGRNFPSDQAARDRWLADMTREHGCQPERAFCLLERYGTRAKGVLAHEAGRNTRSLESATDHTLEELEWILLHEQVNHLDDLLLRRTLLATTARIGRRELDLIANLAGRTLGWDTARTAFEYKRTENLLRERHRMLLS